MHSQILMLILILILILIMITYSKTLTTRGKVRLRSLLPINHRVDFILILYVLLLLFVP